MLLEGKVTVVYGGGGVIGGAAARAFAREGARVHLAGRTRSKLERVAHDISTNGGQAHVAVVDALEEAAVRQHVDAVLEESGRIDVVLNAVGIIHVQGTPFAELTLEGFERPLHAYARSLFITAQAACRPMIARGAGVFLSLSTPASKLGFAGVLGFGTTCAAIEGANDRRQSPVGRSPSWRRIAIGVRRLDCRRTRPRRSCLETSTATAAW